MKNMIKNPTGLSKVYYMWYLFLDGIDFSDEGDICIDSIKLMVLHCIGNH